MKQISLITGLSFLLLTSGCGGAKMTGQSIAYSTCEISNGNVDRTPMRLLSLDEYNNSIQDIFKISSVASDLGKFEEQNPGPSGYSNDTSNINLDSLTVEKYWQAAEAIANTVIATKSATNGAYAKIAACGVNQASVSEQCKDEIARRLGLLVWRRPLIVSAENNEVSRLVNLMNQESSFDSGLKSLIHALLASPNFLYISSTGPGAIWDGQIYNVDPYEYATRISYFLWRSTPDEKLLAAAQSGAIFQPNILDAEIDRMLSDPRSLRMTDMLMREWAGIQGYETMIRDGLSEELKNDMITETRMLFESLVKNDASLFSLIDSNTTFANRRLAQHYGLPLTGKTNAEFTKTSLAGTPRRGFFSLGLFLSLSAGAPDLTHPVKRGKSLAQKLNCIDVPPPPDNVFANAPDLSQLPELATPKDQLAVHSSNPSCKSCHRVLDPYGLAFESFDVVGAWRTTYSHLQNTPIDASAELPSGTFVNSTEELIEQLVNDSQVKKCLAGNLMSMGIARKANSAVDNCVSSQLSAAATTSQLTFSETIKEIVKSPQFLRQKGEGQ